MKESAMPTASAERVAEVFLAVADTLVEEFDVVDFLQMVATRTTELVGADAVGLLLDDGGQRLRFMAGSDERTHLLELFQVQTDEGPCRDCFLQGTAVTALDLERAVDRWPRFAPRAVAAGFRAVHALPLRLRDQVIGALGLFSASTGDLSAWDVRVAQSLADVATIGLLQERAIRRSEVLTEQLQSALNSRIVIEQAKGAIAQLYGVSVDEAFDLLRSHVRRHGLRLTEVARAVVTDPAGAPDLRRP